MTEEYYDDKIEYIPPAWAMEEGTEDILIASSVLRSMNQLVYIYMRQRPPRKVEVFKKGEYEMGMRRMAPEWYMEVRNLDGTRVLDKKRLRLEWAYFEYLDADQKVPFEFAFPGHPELLSLKRDNPLSNNSEVAQLFWNGKSGKSDNMRSTGDSLYSYGTVIMQRLPDGKVITNHTTYSSSTGTHQRIAHKYGTPDYIVHGVRMGAGDLQDYLNLKQIIATSKAGRERVDIVSIQAGTWFHYYREIYGPDYVSSAHLTPVQAYIEYRDADRQLIPFSQAFPHYSQQTLEEGIGQHGRPSNYDKWMNPIVAHCRQCRWKGPEYAIADHLKWKHGIHAPRNISDLKRYISFRESPGIYRVNPPEWTRRLDQMKPIWPVYTDPGSTTGVWAEYYGGRRHPTSHLSKKDFEELLSDDKYKNFAVRWDAIENNPYLGKRHWFFPFNKWHQSGTKLLAQSVIQTRRGPFGVNLYRTRSGKYMRETGFDLGGAEGSGGRIQYISPRWARLDYQEADKRFVPEEEAFT